MAKRSKAKKGPVRGFPYRAAGWAGLGLLAALLVAVGLWALTGAPHESSRPGAAHIERPAPMPPEPSAPAPGAQDQVPEDDGPGLLERGPRAAIIIDDLGNSWREGRKVTSLSYPVAVSVLPGTPFAKRIARRAHARSKEVLLHMPMEPGDDSIPLGPTFLRIGMGRSELLTTLDANLGSIPYVQGVNNHMGSRLTARDRPMRWVMEGLRDRDLFFVDSRTTARSRALVQARAVGIPATERDVFLDHRPEGPRIRDQFRELMAKAREQGTAIAIGHPRSVTLEVLREWLPKAASRGVEIVSVREVLAVRGLTGANGAGLAYRGSGHTEGEEP